MVVALSDYRPEKCIAAITVKNPQWPTNRSVPTLWTIGTGYEWGQMKVDIRTNWKIPIFQYKNVRGVRNSTTWPLSYSLEVGNGHFGVTDKMIELYAAYIAGAVRARLTEKITDYNRESETELPSIEAVAGCRVEPFSYNSVNQVFVNTTTVFTVKGITLPEIPLGFTNAGSKLAPVRSERVPVVKDELILEPVPPRAKRPVKVTVMAWQWGRVTEPKVKTAESVYRSMWVE